MLDKLSSVLKKVTDKVANAIFLDKEMVDGIIKDLQRALIEADVNVRLVIELTGRIKKAALDERIKGLEKKEHIIKLLHEELVKLLGESREIKLENKNIFLIVGLNGQGKTTTISKLASYYAKRGHKVCAVGLDVYRPAAAEQLEQVCNKLNIKSFTLKEEKDPKKIWKKYSEEIKDYELVLIDSAGRDALSTELMEEIKQISKITKPTETFLVIAADLGQSAKKQAEAFKEACNITGVIITRMDSTAKAGGALTACAETKSPVVFIGTGEKPADLELFNPESFLSRLLGMGDLKSLMEKIQNVVGKKEIEEQQKRLEEGKFTLRDMEKQFESLNQMGSLEKLMSFVPGFKNNVPNKLIEDRERKVKHWRAAINSMTKQEIEDPEIIERQTTRIQRIAKGSGTPTGDVRALIKEYKMIKSMINSGSEISFDNKSLMKFARKYVKF